MASCKNEWLIWFGKLSSWDRKWRRSRKLCEIGRIFYEVFTAYIANFQYNFIRDWIILSIDMDGFFRVLKIKWRSIFDAYSDLFFILFYSFYFPSDWKFNFIFASVCEFHLYLNAFLKYSIDIKNSVYIHRSIFHFFWI